MKTYPHILRAAAEMPWAMEPRKLRQVASFLMLKAQGLDVPEDIKADVMALRAAARQPRTGNGVAVVPVLGSISYRANMLDEFSGGTSMQMLQRAFREAVNNPDVGTIVLDIDSPGGSVDGIPEFADEILTARSQKKIIAVADTMAASAAYWIMSAASEAVVTPSGAVGSVGVFMLHIDESRALEAEGLDPTFISAGKFKTEGNPFEPLSEGARENFQSDVDAYYTMFVKAVAKGRGVSVSDVRNGFGQGRLVLAKDAKAQGMVDRVDTLSNVLSRLGVDVGTSSNRQRAEVEYSLVPSSEGATVFDLGLGMFSTKEEEPEAEHITNIRERAEFYKDVMSAGKLTVHELAASVPVGFANLVKSVRSDLEEVGQQVTRDADNNSGDQSRVYLPDDPSAFVYRRDHQGASSVGEVKTYADGRQYIGTDNGSGALFWQRVVEDDGTITFARVDGPPENWFGLKIIDLDTGEEMDQVVECNTILGYVIRHKRDAAGLLVVHRDQLVHEEIKGRFKIVAPEEADAEEPGTKPIAFGHVRNLHNPRHRRLALLRA